MLTVRVGKAFHTSWTTVPKYPTSQPMYVYTACKATPVNDPFPSGNLHFVHLALTNLDSERKSVGIDEHDILGFEVSVNQS